MTSGGYQVNGRGPRPAMVLTTMAGLLALVSMSCHDADQPTARVQVNSARPNRIDPGKGLTQADSGANRPISGLVTSILDPRLGRSSAPRTSGDSREDPRERSSTRFIWFPTWPASWT